jgi:hypothetical protein
VMMAQRRSNRKEVRRQTHKAFFVKKLLDQWSQRATNSDDAMDILARLDTALQHDEMDAYTAFSVIGPIASADIHRTGIRNRALMVMDRVVNDDSVHDSTFDMFWKLVALDKDQAVKVAAASTLSTFEKLNNVQVKQLNALLELAEAPNSGPDEKSTLNTQIAKYLRKALSHQKN